MKSLTLCLVLLVLGGCTTEKNLLNDTTQALDTGSAAEIMVAELPLADVPKQDASDGHDSGVDTAQTNEIISDVVMSETVQDSGSAVVDVQFDAPCEPDCEGKVCGSDGCAGICGYCTYPAVCDASGQCVEVCEKDCDGKSCGPDGCGGDCGSCDEGFDCGEDGLCYEKACQPECAQNTCGPDGCGGDCGLCAAPKICGQFEGCGGLCCSLGPCGTVDKTGECQGDVFVSCVDEVNLVEENCAEQEGYTCLYDPLLGAYGCAEEPECIAKCGGKECGSDGCDGVCGVCTSGWSCELGLCKKEVGASCGDVTVIGSCEGNVHWFCANGKLFNENCSVFGQTCGFIAAESSFGCK
jgi:hypothetical protein